MQINRLKFLIKLKIPLPGRGGNKNNQHLLQNIQNRLVKLVFKNTFEQNKPMNIKQLFTWDCLKYYYNEMKNIFRNSNSKTRNKAILLPKIDKKVSEKNNHITAIKTFNQLSLTLNLRGCRCLRDRLNYGRLRGWSCGSGWRTGLSHGGQALL